MIDVVSFVMSVAGLVAFVLGAFLISIGLGIMVCGLVVVTASRLMDHK